jgi:hypothetical protein
MVWIVSVCCEKLWHDFVAWTFTLIAPVWRVMPLVSCSSETVPNVPKQKEMHQNMRLGSNGMDRECSLWKILTRHRGTNFCINCTSLARFCAIAKRTQMHPNGKNAPKHEFRVQCCGCERSLWKVVSRLRATNFHINCTSLARFASSFVH